VSLREHVGFIIAERDYQRFHLKHENSQEMGNNHSFEDNLDVKSDTASTPLKAKKMSNWVLESPMLSPSRCNSVLADVEKKIQMTMTSSFSIAQIPQFP
jgi:hypothetical protein